MIKKIILRMALLLVVLPAIAQKSGKCSIKTLTEVIHYVNESNELLYTDKIYAVRGIDCVQNENLDYISLSSNIEKIKKLNEEYSKRRTFGIPFETKSRLNYRNYPNPNLEPQILNEQAHLGLRLPYQELRLLDLLFRFNFSRANPQFQYGTSAAFAFGGGLSYFDPRFARINFGRRSW